MTPIKRRLSAIFLFSSIVFVTTGIIFAVYLLHVQQNEIYQNRLYFRELIGLENTFINFTNQITKSLSFPVTKKESNKDEIASHFKTRARKSAVFKNIEEIGCEQYNKNFSPFSIYFHPDKSTYFKFSLKEQGEKSDKLNKLNEFCFKIPTSNLLANGVKLFPQVYFVDLNGTVITKKENDRYLNHSAAINLHSFNTVFQAIKQTKDTHIPNANGKHNTYSGIAGSVGGERNSNGDTQNTGQRESMRDFTFSSTTYDVNLQSRNYKVFVQQVSLDDAFENKYASNASKGYLIGVLPQTELNINKYTLAPSTIRWAIIIFVVAIAAIPLIKIRFVNPRYAFTKDDVSQVCVGLLAIGGILGIGVADQFFYSYYVDTKEEQAENIFKSIQNDFKTDLERLLDRGESIKRNYIKGAVKGWPQFSENKMGRGNPTNIFSYRALEELTINSDSDDENLIYIEGASVLDSRGKIDALYPRLYIKESVANFNQIDLSGREYFQKAIQLDVWERKGNMVTDTSGSQLKSLFYIQSIRNLEDGRKATQISLPLFDSLETPWNERNVMVYNTFLPSLNQRVLPRNFGFAVIDHSGNVLYHSDNQKALNENFYAESDGIESFRLINENSSKIVGSLPIKASYGGQQFHMQAGPLGVEQLSEVPWTLVVFYNEYEADINNLLLIFIATFLYFLVIIPIFLIVRYLIKQHFWSDILYYKNQRDKQYKYLSWLNVGGCIFLITSVGVFESILFRFALWAVVLLTILVMICHAFKINYYSAGFKGTPIYMVGAICIFFLLLAFINKEPGLPSFNINYYIFSFSLILFLGGISYLYKFHFSSSAKDGSESIAMQEADPVPANHTAIYVSKDRYPLSFVLFIFSLLAVTTVSLATFVSNSANSYLLQRQAEMQTYDWENEVNNFQKARTQLLTPLFSSVSFPKVHSINWNSPQRIQQSFSHAQVQWKEGTKYGGSDIGDFFLFDEGDNDSNFASDFTDPVIDHIFHALRLDAYFSVRFDFLANLELSKIANHDTPPIQSDTKEPTQNNSVSFHYRPDKFWLSAMKENPWMLLLPVLFCLVLVAYLLAKLVIRRMMGEHVNNSSLLALDNKKHIYDQQYWIDMVSPVASGGLRKQLIGCSRQRLYDALFKADRLLDNKFYSVSSLGGVNEELSHLVKKTNSTSLEKSKILVIEGFEEIAVSREQRISILEFLKTISHVRWLNILIVCDIAPMYRLIKISQYSVDTIDPVCLDEQLGWAKIFSQFEKEYGWLPKPKTKINDHADIDEILNYESTGWRELSAIKTKFKNEINAMPSDQKIYWNADQIIEYFLAHCGAFYRKQWELCTLGEKLALYQMANGARINPEKDDVIAHLQRRGYIYRCNGWHIINHSFTKFIKNAEADDVFQKWTRDIDNSTWQFIRLPLFTILILLGAAVAVSSGQSLDSVLGIFTATLTLLPLLFKNIHLFKGGGSSSAPPTETLPSGNSDQ
ncbi:hypothetical protein OPS25_07790 [Alteromonas ponticola]|uniref:Uncharacterized protein n=1 Tax=Alteromonas aquimaris TaxID=2998417 RepID=A0ABT3P6J8_9ALTE|nr:hypothetical protein [Alteromonas aquimaris]MCW8108392.1 hypothetical protein [Alteromonas aquimaris]